MKTCLEELPDFLPRDCGEGGFCNATSGRCECYEGWLAGGEFIPRTSSVVVVVCSQHELTARALWAVVLAISVLSFLWYYLRQGIVQHQIGEWRKKKLKNDQLRWHQHRQLLLASVFIPLGYLGMISISILKIIAPADHRVGIDPAASVANCAAFLCFFMGPVFMLPRNLFRILKKALRERAKRIPFSAPTSSTTGRARCISRTAQASLVLMALTIGVIFLPGIIGNVTEWNGSHIPWQMQVLRVGAFVVSVVQLLMAAMALIAWAMVVRMINNAEAVATGLIVRSQAPAETKNTEDESRPEDKPAPSFLKKKSRREDKPGPSFLKILPLDKKPSNNQQLRRHTSTSALLAGHFSHAKSQFSLGLAIGGILGIGIGSLTLSFAALPAAWIHADLFLVSIALILCIQAAAMSRALVARRKRHAKTAPTSMATSAVSTHNSASMASTTTASMASPDGRTNDGGGDDDDE